MPNEGEDNAAAAAMLQSVSIKCPTFMETAAVGWFAIIEAQFHLRNITQSDTKFYHVLSSLPADLVANLNPRILEGKDYDELKKAVVANYEKTKPELFDKLITNTKLTGRPSIYLQELLAVANKVGVGEELVKHKFIQSLPHTIAPVIAAQQDLALQRLGTLADELMPLDEKSTCQVTKSQTNHENNPSNTNTQSSNFTNIGLKPFRPSQRPKICRGHLYYAEKSRTCKPWCKWPNKNNCNILPNSRAPSLAPTVSDSEN